MEHLTGLPPAIFYLIVGVSAAIENIIPPLPADTVILFGAFLAAGGKGSAWIVFLVTWLANVATAIAVYAIARHYGTRISTSPITRWILSPQQLQQVGRFYERYGIAALALSRFLPAFRAVVPIFAGVSRMSWPRVVPAIAIASGLWYGILVAVGTLAGNNWQRVSEIFTQFSRVLLLIAIPLLVLLLIWWWRTRQER